MRNFFSEYLHSIFDLLNYDLFAIGNAKITPLSVIYMIIFAGLLILVSRKLRNILIAKLLTRTKLDTGAQEAIGTIVRYIFLVIGFLIIIQSVGIDLTTLNVLAGAVGVGVGFGLQNIASNFISGLIILFERPIKVGDRIEVDKVFGDVASIGARSSIIKTNDGIAIIVPNSKFISENVVNWSYVSDVVRFRIPVGVSYDADVDLVTKVLLDVAKDNDHVLDDPAPAVRLIGFGDNALNFELWAWTRSRLHRPGPFKSNLNLAILRAFRKNDLSMPFPQRDLHILDGQLKYGKNKAEFIGEPAELEDDSD